MCRFNHTNLHPTIKGLRSAVNIVHVTHDMDSLQSSSTFRESRVIRNRNTRDTRDHFADQSVRAAIREGRVLALSRVISRYSWFCTQRHF